MAPEGTFVTPPAAEQRAVLLATTLGVFISPFILSSLNIALPAIGREFSLTAVELGWVSTTYILAAAALLVPFGKVGDGYGRKRVYVTGMVLLCLASLAFAFVPSYPWLLLVRGLQGVGSAMLFSTATAIVTGVYAPGERGRVLGINVAAVYVGLSLGPVVGGLVTENLGWRLVFVLPSILGLLVVGLFLWRVRDEWSEPSAGRFDYGGSLVYAAGLTLLMLGLSRLPGLDGVGLLAAGVVLLFGFVWLETRAAEPVLDVDLFRRNRLFALSNLAALISYSATFAVAFLLSLYLQYVRGYSAEQAGLLLIFQPVVQAALSPWAGRLSDRVEGRIVASTGMGMTVVGLLLLAFIGADTSVVFVAVTLCLLGLGFALFSSPNTNTIMGSVARRDFGIASATVATMRIMGQAFSMGLAMLVFAVVLGTALAQESDPQDLLLALRVCFAIFTGICVVGVMASLARGGGRQGR